MKFSELKNLASGIPAGFEGERRKWNEINGAFRIVKMAVMQRPAKDEDGEPIYYSRGSRKGEPVQDTRLVMNLDQDGVKYVVMTNSPRLVPLFTGQIEAGQDTDDTNRFGDSIYYVDAPEGLLKFVGVEYTYSDNSKGTVAYLSDVE